VLSGGGQGGVGGDTVRMVGLVSSTCFLCSSSSTAASRVRPHAYEPVDWDRLSSFPLRFTSFPGNPHVPLCIIICQVDTARAAQRFDLSGYGGIGAMEVRNRETYCSLESVLRRDLVCGCPRLENRTLSAIVFKCQSCACSHVISPL